MAYRYHFKNFQRKVFISRDSEEPIGSIGEMLSLKSSIEMVSETVL